MSRQAKTRAVVSLAVVLVVLVPLGLRWQAQWKLRAYRQKLIAAGEKLTVEELAPKRTPQATNAALFLRLAATLRPIGDPSPSAMRSIKPGVARVVWRQPRCMERTNDSQPAIDIWPAFMDAMRTNEQTLDELQTLVNAGGVEFIEDYSQPNFSLPYLGPVKNVVINLNARAMLAMHQGQMQEALGFLKSCGAVSQLTARNPLMIDQLVAYACMAIAATGCWEALQAGGWTDDQLAQLQRPWDKSATLADAGSSIAMERARAPMEFQIARASRQGLANMLGWGSGIHNNAEIWNDFLLNARNGINELLLSYPGYWGWRWIWSYRDEQRYLQVMQTMVEATRDAQKRRSILSFLKDRNQSEFFPGAATNFDLLGSTIGAIEAFVSRALRAQTVANIVASAIALERYRLAHHVYPKALADLAPEFVQAVPVDCMDGHDLRYRLNPDGTFLLYSVGGDGVDNGGDPTPEEGKRLSFFNGRDLVWPRPATAGEMQAYEAEQDKPTKRK